LGTVHLTDVIRGLLEDALSLTKNELDARHRQFNLMCALSHVSASFNVLVYVFVVEKEGGEGRKEGRKGDGVVCGVSLHSLTHALSSLSRRAPFAISLGSGIVRNDSVPTEQHIFL
jgi:hypothetical protein